MGATCTVQHKEILVNSFLKVTKKKQAREISNIQVSDPGPSWPSCLDRLRRTYIFSLPGAQSAQRELL